MGANSRLHMCDLVSKRTELHIDSLLKRGYGNHCLGRLSSCGARRKNFATAFDTMALVTELKNNEHVGNLDLLQELFLRGKGHQRRTIGPLYATCTTWTADLRPWTLIDVAAATPEETETPSRSLCVLLGRLWNCVQPMARQPCQSLGSFCLVLCCCDEPPSASPPKRARVYCGCQPGPTHVMLPSRQDDGNIRAPALCLRGCLWSESCLW